MSLRGRRHGGGRKNELVFLTTCGPATTFDPKITGVAGTWFFDDGTTLAAASGAEISKTFAAEGLHRAVFRPASGRLAAITAIDADTDLITRIENLGRAVSLSRVLLSMNQHIVVSLTSIRSATNVQIYTSGQYVLGVAGNLSDISKATYIALPRTSVSGSICDIPNATEFYLSNTAFVGSIGDLNANVTAAQFLGCVGITAASIAHCTKTISLVMSSVGWLTADVDTVIDSMWSARANYTYATPALQIGGTNEAPTGNVAAPTEGADWTEDTPGHWLPRTTGAKAYDLAKDVNGEGFKKWTITYTGGVIAP